MYVFNAVLVSFPLPYRSPRLIQVPKVNEFTLTSNCKLFNALPFNVETFEAFIDL